MKAFKSEAIYTFREIASGFDWKGQLIMVDDNRIPLTNGEEPRKEYVRFRTLGCYPLTAAIRSNSTTVGEIIHETEASCTSERQGRIIDQDQSGSMERKKREGYF